MSFIISLLTAFHSNLYCPTCIHRIFTYHVSFFLLLSFDFFLSSFVIKLHPHDLYHSSLPFNNPIHLCCFLSLFPVRTPMLIQSQCPPTWLASGTCSSSPLRISALSLMSCSRSGLTTGGLWTRLRGRYKQCLDGWPADPI